MFRAARGRCFDGTTPKLTLLVLRCIEQPHCFLLACFHHPINTHHDCMSHLPITINNHHYNISNNNSNGVNITVAGPCACRHKQACSLRMFHSLTFRFALLTAFCAGVDGIGVSASACSCAGPSVAVVRRRRFGHDSAGAPATAVAGRPCFPARPITNKTRRWLKAHPGFDCRVLSTTQTSISTT